MNGSFEINTSSTCNYNMSNATFSGLMANSTGYGAAGQLDIMSTTCPYGTPQSGSWMVSLATNAGNTDAFTTMLTAPLVTGNTYTMTFYDRGDPNYPPGVPIRIGISTVAGANGTNVYTGPVPQNGPWSLRSFTFTAPNNGQHVSISTTGAPLWTFVDNFCLGCVILPIELSEFTATCSDSGNVLNWTTQSEKNADHFSVERSLNGKDFFPLFEQKGKGSNYTGEHYMFTDKDTPKELSYYRVKQTDLDNSITYSEIITAERCKIKTEFLYNLFPNPAGETIHVSFRNQEENTKIILRNSFGTVVNEKISENAELDLDLSDLSAGLYFITFINGQKILNDKFFKE